MSQKFHINSKNESQPCRATVRACRFGDESHYSNESDAMVESERRLNLELGNIPKLSRTKTSSEVEKSNTNNSNKTINAKSTKPAQTSRSIPKAKVKQSEIKNGAMKSSDELKESPDLLRLPESSYDPADINVIREYRDGANWSINRSLRNRVMPQGRAREAIARIDNLIANSAPITHNTTIQRSMDTELGATVYIPGVGEVYSDPAFLSCSTNKKYIEETIAKGVDEYSDYPSDTILSIELPSGSKAFALPNENEDYIEEAEVLLPRDSRMEIVEDSGFVNGVRRVRARLRV